MLGSAPLQGGGTVGVRLGVWVGVCVGVLLGVLVGVRVAVVVGVFVGVLVGVRVGVMVGEEKSSQNKPLVSQIAPPPSKLGWQPQPAHRAMQSGGPKPPPSG